MQTKREIENNFFLPWFLVRWMVIERWGAYGYGHTASLWIWSIFKLQAYLKLLRNRKSKSCDFRYNSL